MRNVLKAFIVGSSWFSFILFFTGFDSLKSSYNMKNMEKITNGINPYFVYTICAPLYFAKISTPSKDLECGNFFNSSS